MRWCSLSSVASLVSEVTQATVEQSSGIEQVNGSVVKIDETTQHNAALVEEAASAAASLQEQAARLAREVSVFPPLTAGLRAREGRATIARPHAARPCPGRAAFPLACAVPRLEGARRRQARWPVSVAQRICIQHFHLHLHLHLHLHPDPSALSRMPRPCKVLPHPGLAWVSGERDPSSAAEGPPRLSGPGRVAEGMSGGSGCHCARMMRDGAVGEQPPRAA